MTMKICHFSDWHAHAFDLPPADLYICTGDMYNNFVKGVCMDTVTGNRVVIDLAEYGYKVPPQYMFIERLVDHEHEMKRQAEWAKANQLREKLGSPDSPVVVVRGNHDFISLQHLFEGCDVWEVNADPTRTTEVKGLKIGGMRGVPALAFEWSDELPQETISSMSERLPDDIDLLITHCPPRGILDQFGHSLGSQGLRGYINKRFYSGRQLKGHFFGHIHEARDSKNIAQTIFSNAATTWMVYDI